MFEMLFPVFMYFIDSILSVIYTWSFQEGRYRKKIVFVVWRQLYQSRICWRY